MPEMLWTLSWEKATTTNTSTSNN